MLLYIKDDKKTCGGRIGESDTFCVELKGSCLIESHRRNLHPDYKPRSTMYLKATNQKSSRSKVVTASECSLPMTLRETLNRANFVLETNGRMELSGVQEFKYFVGMVDDLRAVSESMRKEDNADSIDCMDTAREDDLKEDLVGSYVERKVSGGVASDAEEDLTDFGGNLNEVLSAEANTKVDTLQQKIDSQQCMLGAQSELIQNGHD